jgi:hypothetical protein
MDITKWISENKQIVAAILAGIFAITAAYIRRDRRFEKVKKPGRRLLMPPFLCFVLGAGLLGAEYFVYNMDYEAFEKNSLDVSGNPGAALAFGGCLFLAISVIWGFANFVRLVTHKPVKEEPAPAEDAQGSTVVKPASKPVSKVAPNVKKRPV